MSWRLWENPAIFKGHLDNRKLDGTDGNRGIINRKRTGTFAGCGTNSASNLREVIGKLEAVIGLAP